jgi:dTDP-4-dehydrorhamnose 3,5-epimerase
MDDIRLSLLKQITNPKGDLYHALKKSDDSFNGFGEAYFTTVNFDEIKGWKKHTKMILNLIVPVGAVKFVIFNDETGEFKDITLSQSNYQRLTVPSGLWVAFKGVSNELNLVLNIANIEHDPSESENCLLEEIKYEW